MTKPEGKTKFQKLAGAVKRLLKSDVNLIKAGIKIDLIIQLADLIHQHYKHIA